MRRSLFVVLLTALVLAGWQINRRVEGPRERPHERLKRHLATTSQTVEHLTMR